MKITRMLQAINHQKSDRVPRGELLIDQEIIDLLVPKHKLSEFEQKKAALNKLQMDFVAIESESLNLTKELNTSIVDPFGRKLVKINDYWQITGPAIGKIDEAYQYQFPKLEQFDFREIEKWVKGSDLFVFALIDGIFQGVASLLNFNEFLISTVRNQREIKHLANGYGDFLCLLATKALETGAHGLIIGDDMASSRGALISPKTMEKLFYPIYKRVLKELNSFQKPIILHCDGNIEFLLPHLKKLGFVGTHSLEPAAGMDLETVKKQYGHELCLIGNIDPALLGQNNISLVEKAVKDALKIGSPGGGYILSTASGSLTKDMNLEGILAMYQC